jgi:hypothetical protein
MRKYGIYRALPFLTAILLFLAGVVHAQNSKNNKKQEKTAEIQQLIQSKSFVFVAQNAAPQTGRNINLTSSYDLRLSKDTLIAALPYYGRAYVAPMNPSEGGFNFTSTKFTYTIAERKKGGWDINLQPSDTKDVRQMLLTVSEDGYASLQVTSNNRQPISFTGYITSKSKTR